ncbi:MAG: hypothetical protein JNM17_28795 [Archangium sp.]|nr:hypothetical protein [Archangium sp.]
MSTFFSMKGFANEPIVLLYSLPEPGDHDSWLWGRRFSVGVVEPVEVVVIPDHDQGVLMPFYNTPQIMRRDVLAALRDAGVDNLDTYAAVVKTEAGRVVSDDYVAYNVIGVARAADLQRTRFAVENESRLIDASIERLSIDRSRTGGLLLFRLAESLRTVIVHESVRAAVERRGIRCIEFHGEDDFTF